MCSCKSVTAYAATCPGKHMGDAGGLKVIRNMWERPEYCGKGQGMVKTSLYYFCCWWNSLFYVYVFSPLKHSSLSGMPQVSYTLLTFQILCFAIILDETMSTKVCEQEFGSLAVTERRKYVFALSWKHYREAYAESSWHHTSSQRAVLLNSLNA